MRVNPFRPGSVVNPGMFAGRGAELIAIDTALFQTKNNNPQHLLIHGERGIGKSSLLGTARSTAIGDFAPVLEGVSNFNFVPISVCVDPNTTYANLVAKIGAELARELGAREGIKSLLGTAWEFAKRWEVGGVKYNEAAPGAADDPLEDLARTFATATKNLADKIDGVFLSIDEADQGAAKCQLGEFVKLFTERLSALGCGNVGIVISGISSVIDDLRNSHPSSVRILTALRLETLLPGERIQVIRLGLEVANEKNQVQTSITPEAAEWISRTSEGYPHFIQQYAYSAFDTDEDGEISHHDVTFGAYKEHGALDQLGARYFEEMYLDKINTDEQRQVVHVLAETGEGYLSRGDVKSRTGLRETTLTNALAALTKREVIVKHREKQGQYKLPNSSFATWVRARLAKERVGVAPD